MKNVLIKNVIIFATLWLLIGAGTAIGSEKYLGNREQVNEQKMAIIQIGGSRPGIGGEQIKVPLSKVERIKGKLSNLLDETNENEFTAEELIEGMLRIFREEKILPKEFTYENFSLIAQRLADEIMKQPKIMNRLLPSFMSKRVGYNGANSLGNNVTWPQLQIGLITLKGVFALGGPFGWGFQVTPFPPYQNATELETINRIVQEVIPNLSFTGYITISPNVILRLPGSPMGATGIISLIPFPGFEEFKYATWIGKTSFGVEIGLFGLGIAGFLESEVGTQIIFDAAVQLIPFTWYIAYVPHS